MLGISFDYKLKFTNHNDEICKKESQKFNALAMDFVNHSLIIAH